MAILWQTTREGVRYEVRGAGSTVRLYADGVLHSQFNPGQPLTGHVWDLLLLPVYFRPPQQTRRVLVLGVGGGTVIRQLRQFVPACQITGIESSAVHLDIAARFFGVDSSAARLVHADARRWLQAYRGDGFDLVIDDLFGHANGDPLRSVTMTPQWCKTLFRSLRRGGVLTVNFDSGRQLRDCPIVSHRSMRRRYRCGFRFGTRHEENAVGAFVRSDTDSGTLRQRLRQVPVLNAALRTGRLRYTIRTLR